VASSSSVATFSATFLSFTNNQGTKDIGFAHEYTCFLSDASQYISRAQQRR
jgi:hypothetical protein